MSHHCRDGHQLGIAIITMHRELQAGVSNEKIETLQTLVNDSPVEVNICALNFVAAIASAHMREEDVQDLAMRVFANPYWETHGG